MNKRKKDNRTRFLAFYALLMTVVAIGLLSLSIFLSIKKKESESIIAEREEALNLASEELKQAEIENAGLNEENRELSKTNKFLNETSTGAQFRQKLKEQVQSGMSRIQILKYFFPEQLIIADQGKYHFIEILKDLKKSPYLEENFSLNSNNEMEYLEDGENIALKGIDVSKFNGHIDWEKVAASGVRFAYIRAGLRGYGTGKIVKDELFEENVKGAVDAGLEVGVYFFTQAVNVDEAMEEAEFVMDLISDNRITCPIAYDLERVEDSKTKPRTADLTQEQMTKNTIAFCERLKIEGYTPIIYGNIKTFLLMLDMTRLENYEKWYAGYISKNVFTPYFPYEFRIWQYKSTGKVDGVNGKCDMNIAFY